MRGNYCRIPSFLTAIGEGDLEKGVVGEADDGAVGEDAAVFGVIVRLAQLQQEVASAKIRDERLQISSMLASAVEVGAEPGAHGRFLFIARLGYHHMEDGGINASMEVAVGDRLQFFETPVILSRFVP